MKPLRNSQGRFRRATERERGEPSIWSAVSEPHARGHVTRKAKQRARVMAKAAELRGEMVTW